MEGNTSQLGTQITGGNSNLGTSLVWNDADVGNESIGNVLSERKGVARNDNVFRGEQMLDQPKEI